MSTPSANGALPQMVRVESSVLVDGSASTPIASTQGGVLQIGVPVADGVNVGVIVGVDVGVRVGRGVNVALGVGVSVMVDVAVAVCVATRCVGVAVGISAVGVRDETTSIVTDVEARLFSSGLSGSAYGSSWTPCRLRTSVAERFTAPDSASSLAQTTFSAAGPMPGKVTLGQNGLKTTARLLSDVVNSNHA